MDDPTTDPFYKLSKLQIAVLVFRAKGTKQEDIPNAIEYQLKIRYAKSRWAEIYASALETLGITEGGREDKWREVLWRYETKLKNMENEDILAWQPIDGLETPQTPESTETTLQESQTPETTGSPQTPLSDPQEYQAPNTSQTPEQHLGTGKLNPQRPSAPGVRWIWVLGIVFVLIFGCGLIGIALNLGRFLFGEQQTAQLPLQTDIFIASPTNEISQVIPTQPPQITVIVQPTATPNVVVVTATPGPTTEPIVVVATDVPPTFTPAPPSNTPPPTETKEPTPTAVPPLFQADFENEIPGEIKVLPGGGELLVVEGQLKAVGETHFLISGPNWTDYEVSLYAPSEGCSYPKYRREIYVRSESPSNGYMYKYIGCSSHLGIVEKGEFTSLIEPGSTANSTTYSLRVVGNRISLYIDGTEIGNFIDDRFTSGGVVIYMSDGQVIDDLIIRSIP